MFVIRDMQTIGVTQTITIHIVRSSLTSLCYSTVFTLANNVYILQINV